MSVQLLAAIIFIFFYAMVLSHRVNYVIAAIIGVSALFLTRLVSPAQALGMIDVNVMGVFVGTMILSTLFIFSDVPKLLSAWIVSLSKNVGLVMLFVCMLSGVISIVTENIATVLIVAPIAFEISKKLNINPVPFLIGVAISSNLQGCATMIGDPPSIILAVSNNMNFMDFFWMKGKPGIAFAVEIGALASCLVLYLFFRSQKDHVEKIPLPKVKTWVPTYLMSGMILCLAAASFVPNKPEYYMAYICMFWAVIGFVWHLIFHKETVRLMKDFDWQTLVFLAGIFIMVGSLTITGCLETVAVWMSGVLGQNVLAAYVLIIIVSIIVSAFVDNIPYITAMIPVVKTLSAELGIGADLLLFGLFLGACLGGNITPIGANANITGMGLLRQRGYKVSFLDFFKIGFPFTLAAVTAGTIFVWVVWR